MKVFYPKKRKKAEQRKKSGKMVKKRKLSAKSGRGGNPGCMRIQYIVHPVLVI
jgi:hypothetical protein